MAVNISIHSNKGGVYKTSTVVSISVNLAKIGYKVLIVDCDAQNNVILNFKDVVNNENTLFDLVINQDSKNLDKYIKTVSKNIDLIENSFDSLNVDYNIYTNPKKYPEPLELFEFIDSDEIQEYYDFVLFDLSSAYTLYNLNALAYSDYVLMLTELEPFSIAGLIENIKIITNNSSIKILGILETKVVKNTKTYKNIHEQLITNMKMLDIYVFNTQIERLAEQPNYLLFEGENISLATENKKTSWTYKNLTNEILNILKKEGVLIG